MEILSYLFWPNLGVGSYGSPTVAMLLALCGSFVVLALVLRIWRGRLGDSILRKLSRSWSRSAFVFGITGLFLVVSRVEGISYISMRFLWVVWLFFLLAYLFVQMRVFRSRYYRTLPQERADDPRAEYLPGR